MQSCGIQQGGSRRDQAALPSKAIAGAGTGECETATGGHGASSGQGLRGSVLRNPQGS